MTLEYKKSAFVSQKRISVDARGQVNLGLMVHDEGLTVTYGSWLQPVKGS